VHLTKRVALDQVHGNFRTDCREVIRVDKDKIFESWAEFEDYLRTLVMQPQQIVYVRDDRYPERVTKPHLLYILPEKRGVWYSNSLSLAMFNGAAAALTVMAGGDIGGLANVLDCKLPTSPHNCDRLVDRASAGPVRTLPCPRCRSKKRNRPRHAQPDGGADGQCWHR
jgi:hypothetical protein